jgi:Ca-activated chloride channel family protein
VRELPVHFPEREARHDVLATLWARTRVADLMGQDYLGIQGGIPREDLRDQITRLGLDFGLMTQYTSFVAVEEITITEGGQPRRVEVPVEIPDGVDPRGIFGEAQAVAGAVGGAMPAMSVSVDPTKFAAPPARHVQRAVLPAEILRETDARRKDEGAVTARPEDRRRQIILSKLHPDLAGLIGKPGERIQTAAVPAGLVKDGKACVQVRLSDKSAETMQKLKALGFELIGEPGSAPVVLGRIPVERLAALAELEAVRYVAPF